MKRATDRVRRACPALLAVVVVVSAAAVPGCKSANQRATKPASVYLDPALLERDIKTVVFAGVHSGVTDEQAPLIVRDILTNELKTTQNRFIIIGPEEAANLASRAGAGETYQKVQSVWKSYHKVDPGQAQELCEALAADALLLASVRTWEREQVDWVSEGRSFTQVGLELRIVDPVNGKPIWTARDSRLKESERYEFSETGMYSEAIGGEESVTRTERSPAPEPPKFEDVTQEVAAVLVASLASIDRPSAE